MGKKTKTGKDRRDEYYRMAKEAGYRARAAFKLIEINKKFHFLESSKILIDLCAAPGSWMQVATKTMKKSSLIIGVDLVKIDPIPGAIAIKADITSDICRSLIKNHVHTAKADVILHDGAPNVGTDWNIDECQQAVLCLKSFTLATEFLARNGTFVTKVFRSKDYDSLKWVFDQLFEKVVVIKPRSSRNVSAEIFLVCLKYKAPANLDPKFTDPKFVFEDIDDDKQKDLTFERVQKMKKKAHGYDDNLYKEINVTELLVAEKPMNILLTSNKVIFDDEDVKQHPSTDDMIRNYLTDLKLLGKHEFKKLKNWLRKVIPLYQKKIAPEPETKKEEEPVPEKTEEEEIEEQILKCENEIKRDEKKQQRKDRKEKMKKIKLIQQSMLHPGDSIPQDNDVDLFSARKHKDLIESGEVPLEMDLSQLDEMLGKEDKIRKGLKKMVRPTKTTYKRDSEKYYDTGDDLILTRDSDDDSEMEEEVQEEETYEHYLENGYESSEEDDDNVKYVTDADVVEREGDDEDDEEDISEDVEDISEDVEDISEGVEEDKSGVEEKISGDDEEDISEDDEEDISEDDEEDMSEDDDDISEDDDDISEDDDDISEDEECNVDLDDSVEGMDVDEKIEDDSDEQNKDEKDNDSGSSDEEVLDIDEEEEVKQSRKRKIGVTDLDYDPNAITKDEKRNKSVNAWVGQKEFQKLMNDSDSDDESESGEVLEDAETLIENIGNTDEPKSKKPKLAKTADIVDNRTKLANTINTKLTSRERAIAVEMIRSAKSRREIIDWSYNKYQFEDDKTPKWFAKEEKKFMKPAFPFLDEQKIKEQKEAVSTNINKKTIKKVEQAKARKKIRLTRKLSKMNQRTNKIDDNLTEIEKNKKLKDLNKKVKMLKSTKKPVSIEVTNRSGIRQRSGKYQKGAKVRVVDTRMKSDMRTVNDKKKKAAKKRRR